MGQAADELPTGRHLHTATLGSAAAGGDTRQPSLTITCA